MRRTNFNMTEEEFLGYDPKDVQCRNCSDICGNKVTRMYKNRPFVICSNKPEGQSVLKNSHIKR